ncbi:MAG TPA: hypothetical protein VKI18_03650, partial [Albitalea sp.]|nr:hypothetical protein [Albitalea sp.]
MATSPLLGGERAPIQAPGRDVDSLGPSDRSDSGSDVQGELDLYPDSDLENHLSITPGRGSDSDSGGTGERGGALPESDVREGDDILPDQVSTLSDEAEAEEAPAQPDL